MRQVSQSHTARAALRRAIVVVVVVPVRVPLSAPKVRASVRLRGWSPILQQRDNLRLAEIAGRLRLNAAHLFNLYFVYLLRFPLAF